MTARHEAPPADRWRIPSPSEMRKGLIGLAGAATQLAALGILHGTVLHVVQGTAAVVTGVLTYVVPNARAPLARPAPGA